MSSRKATDERLGDMRGRLISRGSPEKRFREFSRSGVMSGKALGLWGKKRYIFSTCSRGIVDLGDRFQ